MKTLLVASDVHLSDSIWKHMPILGDSFYSWQQIVGHAINRNVDGVLLAGDILDKQVNQAKTVGALLDGLARLTRQKIPVYFNQGQHEFQVEPWMLINSNLDVTWLHQKTIEINGWKIVGCDYQNEEKFKAFLKSPLALSADILVCHQVWQDFMGENAKPQASFADIPKSVQCLITGDYHEHIVRRVNDLIVLSPGSTHLRSLSEPTNKSVFLLQLNESDLSVADIELRTRRVYQFKTTQPVEVLLAQAEAALEDAKAYAEKYDLPEELHKPVFRLTHSMDDTLIVRLFKNKFTDNTHLFFKPVITAQEKEKELPKLSTGNKTNLINCLDGFIDKEAKPKAYGLALSLLSEPEPEQALNRWLEEQTNV